MREILFRGKRIDNGEWVYGGYYVIPDGEGGAIHRIAVSDCERFEYNDVVVDPSTVGQYTGLTDKNGKKIFEGDIVDCLEYYGEVYYDPDCCFDIRDNTSEMCGGFIGDYNSIEVVGNIHDNFELFNNSELLEDKL